MSGAAMRLRRTNWVLVGLLGCVVAYVCCYLYCGEVERDDTGTFKRPTTIRSYRSPLLLAFAPAAWIEANVTNRTIVIGEKIDGGLGPNPTGVTVTYLSMTLYKWIVDPGWSPGASSL